MVERPQFRPVPGALAFSEHLLGLAPISTPVIWRPATRSWPTTWRSSWRFRSARSGRTLVFSISRRHDIAFLAGLGFAFAPYRLPQIAHVQVLSACWMPVALGALHRYFDERRARWLVVFAAAWLLQALACGYYFFFLSRLDRAVARMVGGCVGRGGDLVRVVAAWTVAAALLAPVLYGYGGSRAPIT